MAPPLRALLHALILAAAGLGVPVPGAVAVPAGPGGEAVPAADGALDRPDPCEAGADLGPIRVQVGAVEALTEVGAPIAIPVRVKGVCGLGGFSFWLQFDRGIADLVDVQETPFLAGDPAVEVEFLGLRPGAPRQTIAGRRPPGSGGVDGIGTLARLIFVGRNPGRTEVHLVRLQLFDPEGKELASQAVPMRLNVLPAGSIPPGARPQVVPSPPPR